MCRSVYEPIFVVLSSIISTDALSTWVRCVFDRGYHEHVSSVRTHGSSYTYLDGCGERLEGSDNDWLVDLHCLALVCLVLLVRTD